MMRKLVDNIIKNIKYLIDTVTFCFSTVFRASKLLFIAQFLNQLITVGSSLIGLWAFRGVLNSLYEILINKTDKYNLFIFWITIYVITGLLSKLLDKIFDFLIKISYNKVERYLDCLVVEKIMNIDIAFFDSPKANDKLNIVTGYKSEIKDVCIRGFVIFGDTVMTIGSFILLCKLNIFLSLFILIIAIPVMKKQQEYEHFMQEFDVESSNKHRKINCYKNILMSKEFASEVRLYDLSDFFVNRYFSLWEEWFKERNVLKKKFLLKMSLYSMLNILGIVAVFLISAIKIYNKVFMIGDMQYYINLTNKVSDSINSVFFQISELDFSTKRIREFKEFLEWEPKVKNSGSRELDTIYEITFKDVGFKYPETDKWVLRGLNFTINKDEKVALVGLNGSGKTTIVKLLLRFYDVDEGEILVNGTNIKEFDINSYRKQFSTLFQDYVNYCFTLKESITVSDLDISDDKERLESACKMSGVDDLLSEFEKGVDTPLSRIFSTDGKELSGGQWQKVALARAFFRRSNFIILDEPSASLDPEAEYKIFTKFIELWKDKGAVIISHRLANTVLADKIIFIENGRAIEQGRFEELIKLKGRYRYLFDLQASKYKIEDDAVS